MTRLAGLVTQIIGSVGEGKDQDLPGLGRGDSENWRNKMESISVQYEHGENHIRIQLGETVITGAVVIGDQAIARVLRDLIVENVNVSPIRSDLIAKPARLMNILPQFHNSWRRQYEAK